MAVGVRMVELLRLCGTGHRVVLSDIDGPDDAKTFTATVVWPTEATEHNRTCAECAMPFVARNGYARFCSGACRVRNFRRQEPTDA